MKIKIRNISLTPKEREKLFIETTQQLIDGRITLGVMLSELRTKVLRMNQEQYAKLVGVSTRTISNIETDSGDPSVSTLNAVFKPFGFRVGLYSKDSLVLNEAVKNHITTLEMGA